MSGPQAHIESADPSSGGGRPHRIPALSPTACERCGAPVKVTILEGYVDGEPVRRNLCLACADLPSSSEMNMAARARRPKTSIGASLVVGGALLALIGVLADQLGHKGQSGFGTYQLTAVLVGGLFIVLGAVMRADMVAIFGTVIAAIGAAADLFGTVGTPGLGWRQRVLILVGLVVASLGLSRWRIASRQATRNSRASLPPKG